MIDEVVEAWNRAERAAGVGPEYHSFALDASDAAPRVLLVHGAGGSPADFRELGTFLRSRGWTVLCPLLPGHGRDPVALGDVRFRELVDAVLEAYDVLRDGDEAPAVVAQSLGAVLATQLAARRPVRCLAALAPAFRPFVLRRIWLLGLLFVIRPRLAAATWRWQWRLLRGIRETRGLLGDVRCPLLVLHSRDDDSVSSRGAREMHDDAGSRDKRLVELEGQGHVLSLAPDRRERVFAPTLELMRAATAGEAGSRTSDPRPGAA